ncbi:SMI1/KNR4 family protein [Streptomyces lincolnensis]|uniref:SMI1/KNR4 family protein n=1 Tax=Streptomyces lincolnensis TaxID=1915 RepID=UPI001E632F28|nr:SMI1/KNR4 family protein [Streptomyces lincolnensis]
MGQRMWRELAMEFPDVELRGAAAESSLADIEEQLGQPLPSALRALLMETDGIEAKHGADPVWASDRILAENLAFRRNEQFEALYMPFDALMFFGDNGGGDQFAFVRTPERDDVFVWDHETDSRTWISPSLARFLRAALVGEGEDWYRQ